MLGRGGIDEGEFHVRRVGRGGRASEGPVVDVVCTDVGYVGEGGTKGDQGGLIDWEGGAFGEQNGRLVVNRAEERDTAVILVYTWQLDLSFCQSSTG